MSTISIVVPCYNEAESLPTFVTEVKKVIDTLQKGVTEIIMIDDGSEDATLEVMRQLAREDERVHYVSFSRNFGKESAMLAGLARAKGDYVAVMDADLQDPPSLLPEMLKVVRNEGFDCAGTRRVTRVGETVIRSFSHACFTGASI